MSRSFGQRNIFQKLKTKGGGAGLFGITAKLDIYDLKLTDCAKVWEMHKRTIAWYVQVGDFTPAQKGDSTSDLTRLGCLSGVPTIGIHRALVYLDSEEYLWEGNVWDGKTGRAVDSNRRPAGLVRWAYWLYFLSMNNNYIMINRKYAAGMLILRDNLLAL